MILSEAVVLSHGGRDQADANSVLSGSDQSPSVVHFLSNAGRPSQKCRLQD